MPLGFGSGSPSTLGYSMAAVRAGGLILEANREYAKGRFTEALPLYEEALAARREVLGDNDPKTLVSMLNLGVLLEEMGDLAGAAELLREEVTGMRAVFGPTDKQTLNGARFLRHVLKKLGDDEGAAAPRSRVAWPLMSPSSHIHLTTAWYPIYILRLASYDVAPFNLA